MANLNTAGLNVADVASAAQHQTQEQLGFPQISLRRQGASRRDGSSGKQRAPLCGGCRAKEARYGFLRDGDDPTTERPRTLCFECFRVELGYRQDVNARLARGWNASQVPLPLEEKLKELTHRRRRAQIAARHALGL